MAKADERAVNVGRAVRGDSCPPVAGETAADDADGAEFFSAAPAQQPCADHADDEPVEFFPA
jgi:hypothetical protein